MDDQEVDRTVADEIADQLLEKINTQEVEKKAKWQPKKWRIEYERIVGFSALGWSNKMIAQKTGYTEQHVSNILNLPESEAIREKLLEALRQKTTKTVTEYLSEAAEKTAQRIHQVVHDDELFQRSPFAVIDRGLELLKGTGHLKSPVATGSGVNIQNAIMLPSSAANDLTEGLSKANEVARLHSPSEHKKLGNGKPDNQ